MKVMVLVKAGKDSEAGVLPSEKVDFFTLAYQAIDD